MRRLVWITAILVAAAAPAALGSLASASGAGTQPSNGPPWQVRVRTTDGIDREFAVPDRAVTVCEGVAHLPAGTTVISP